MDLNLQNSFAIKTLGCKANLYDSQLLECELKKWGWIRANENVPAKLCIINSCTVTDEAHRQSRKLASRMARENPDSWIVITGCGAETSPEELLETRGVHYVVGNHDKPSMISTLLKKLETSRPARAEVLGSARHAPAIDSRHAMDLEWPGADQGFSEDAFLQGVHEEHLGQTRTFLKIQEGCNSFCTYCIIPYGRGPSRSIEPDVLIQRIKKLTQAGVREIVLTGTNIGDYGSDISEKPMLATLLKQILGETDLQRLRVSSLDPTEITFETLTLMKLDSRFCPHFHVSLQSPSSRILKLMKRRYGIKEVEECLNSVQAVPAGPGGPFVGMDVITGFPGETEDEFEWTYRVLESLPWSRLHVFPYSERAGTPATRLPGVVKTEARRYRAKLLSQLSLNRLKSHYEKALQESRESGLKEILVEGHKTPRGYTPNYLRVKWNLGEGSLKRNELHRATPTRIEVDPASGEAWFWVENLI